MEDAHHSPNVLSFTCAIEVGVIGCPGCLGCATASLPGLSLGHRVGRGVAPVAAHAEARPATDVSVFWHSKICKAMHENQEMIDFDGRHH